MNIFFAQVVHNGRRFDGRAVDPGICKALIKTVLFIMVEKDVQCMIPIKMPIQSCANYLLLLGFLSVQGEC